MILCYKNALSVFLMPLFLAIFIRNKGYTVLIFSTSLSAYCHFTQNRILWSYRMCKSSEVKVSVAWKTFFWLFGCFLLVSYPASGIGINVCRDYSFLTLKGMCIQHYPDAIGTLKWHFRNRVHKHFWVPDNCYSLLFLLEEYLFYFTVICNMICDFSAAPLWRQMNCHETDNEKQKRCTQAQWGENKES